MVNTTEALVQVKKLCNVSASKVGLIFMKQVSFFFILTFKVMANLLARKMFYTFVVLHLGFVMLRKSAVKLNEIYTTCKHTDTHHTQ